MGTSRIDAGSQAALLCPSWLPDDILDNIFARLPAKSVCQCRCLSRAWAATLSSDDFVDRYHRLANRRHNPRVFFLHYSFHDGPQMRVWSQDRPSEASSRMDVPRPTNGNTLRSTDEGRSALRKTIPSFDGPIYYPREFPLSIVPLVCRILRYAYRLLYGAPVQSYGPMNWPPIVGQSLSATTDDAPPVTTPRPGRSYGGPLRLATLQCRGLVVLQNSDAEINYLCNPSTGQIAALPQGQIVGQKERNEDVSSQHYASLGLGYDVHAKKHKVVRVYYRGRDLEGLPRSAGCEVYVINSMRPYWQSIREKPPAFVRCHEPSVFAQGHVHWLAHRKVNISNNTPVEMSIVSFSLTDHTFGTVALPLGMESESLSKHKLTELDGHLCLFTYNVSRTSSYDIWMLPEHGSRVWNLRCRIDLSKVSPDITDRFVRCRLYPLAIINNGSRILLVQPRLAFAHNYSRLCAYDPLTGDVDDIFNGSSMVYHSLKWSIDAAVYEESIISIGR